MPWRGQTFGVAMMVGSSWAFHHCQTSRTRMGDLLATEDNSILDSDPKCEESVPGSVIRDCALRNVFATCSDNEVCKCPIYSQMQGDDSLCDPSLYHDGRRFDPTKLLDKGCKCVTPQWVPTERKVIKYDCPTESYFGSIRPDLPDFAATALQWCNSKLVPKDKLVPESLRGLYWMKGSNPTDVAFCTTRAEWDAEKLTAKLSPWTDFVWRKRDDEVVPAALMTKSHQSKFGSVYTMQFSNESLTYANITANVGAINWFVNFPLMEVQQTDDGRVVSTKKGDLFARPSSVMGKRIAKYFAVRIVDDDGDINQDWYDQFKEADHEVGTSFVRYEQDCLSTKTFTTTTTTTLGTKELAQEIDGLMDKLAQKETEAIHPPGTTSIKDINDA